MRKSQIEKLRDAKKKYEDQVQMSIEDLMKLLVDGSRPVSERRLNPTQREVILATDRMSAYMGPAGCAKTSTICTFAWLRSLLHPGNKTFIGRYDYNDLMGTTKQRMEEMLSRLPKGILIDRDKSPPERWYVRPIPMPDPVTGEVRDEPSEFMFMGMKDSLGSYEFHVGIVDEADEVEEKRVHELGTRLRAPIPASDGDWRYRIVLCFNPPDNTHWLYTAATGKDFQDKFIKPPWLRVWVPRPDENVRNLPAGYYDDLAKHLPEDMKVRLIEGQWGATFPGAPVFREFKFNLHVVDDLVWDGSSTMYRFWDFGYNRPYCCWAYVDWLGRLKVLHETLGHKEEARAFARRCIGISNERFPNAQFVDFGDPAVRQKKDTGSTLADFAKEGIQMRYRILDIEPGLRLIRQRLNLLIDGEPALQFSRNGVPILIKAFRGGYHFKDKPSANGKIEPVKDGFYDHPMDGFRYGLTNLYSDGLETVPQIITNYASLPSSIEYTGE